jgi:hypothetical protein
MAKSHLKLVTPRTVNRTVTPRRLPNGKLRIREYLTEAEVERLTAEARGNRHGHRRVRFRSGGMSALSLLHPDEQDISARGRQVRSVP